MLFISPDTSKVIVNVSLGIHVEFSLTEALEFIDKKENHLNK
jgi:prefoldin subunit 5